MENAVKCAEQTISTGGKDKKAAVMEWMGDWLAERNLTVSPSQLSQLIESAVYGMKEGKKWPSL